MSVHSDDEMERLANRLAMLASESGEADNAGRAVGALARKLGLSGGDLKEIFLAGIRPGQGTRANGARRPPEDAARLAREVSSLRHSLTLAEVAARAAQRERDALRAENAALMAAFDRQRTSRQVTQLVGGTMVAAALIGGILLYYGPSFHRPPGKASEQVQPSGSPFVRSGVVRSPGANVRDKADPSAAIVATLPAGTRVTVRRIFWNALLQWAEVDVGGVGGFILTTDVDLS